MGNRPQSADANQLNSRSRRRLRAPSASPRRPARSQTSSGPPMIPWLTSMPRPSMTLQPRAVASRTRRVLGGSESRRRQPFPTAREPAIDGEPGVDVREEADRGGVDDDVHPFGDRRSPGPRRRGCVLTRTLSAKQLRQLFSAGGSDSRSVISTAPGRARLRLPIARAAPPRRRSPTRLPRGVDEFLERLDEAFAVGVLADRACRPRRTTQLTAPIERGGFAEAVEVGE